MRNPNMKHIFIIFFAANLASCTQMPHHSNTVFFGTNTSVGIQVAQDTTTAPSVSIGYRRQEAVVMPLLANTSFTSKDAPTPCTVVDTANTSASPPVSCFFQGNLGSDKDTYSVLASFGAEFSGSSKGGDAAGGLAQYFATGLAARRLAEAGSSLVNVSAAATAEAKASQAKYEARAKEIEKQEADSIEVIAAFVNDGQGNVDQSRLTTLINNSGTGLNSEDFGDIKTVQDLKTHLRESYGIYTESLAKAAKTSMPQNNGG